MVGLSDIPCVGKIVDRISDATVDLLFHGFNYMFYYKEHVTDLQSKIQQLNTETDRMSRKVEEEKGNGKIIIDQVEIWQTEVEGIQKSAQEFSEKYKDRSSWRCIQCMPIPKPISRFRLGREAVHTARRVIELSNSARDLLTNDVAYLPPVPNVPTSLAVFEEFQSRIDAYKELWEALVTDGGPPILGIYGMPGVGKTRMAEQIWKEAKEKNIFNKVARAVVGSEEVDVIKLQNQIGGHLNCNFESQDNVERRASQLKNSIMNGEKILVILDDVWREISLDSIGIPLGDASTSKGLKILITSRDRMVCLHNNCDNPVEITMLTVDEAWELFRNTVVNDKYNFPDESLAKKVCNKCAGLPLLICAVGKTLQYTFQYSWKDALRQLEKGQVENIAKINPQVYACVKLSIDALPVDARSCLFLCSLYPEDAEIYIRKLIQIATDTKLVPQGEYRVRNMVDILRSASLLLDCEQDHRIKLHDLIRDVARSIAVEDPKYAVSIVRCGSQLPDNVGTRKFLHLHLEKNDFLFPDNLACPDLHNLWLRSNRYILPEFSSGFFYMFANLKFLLIEDIKMRFSLQALGNLKALILDECNLEETDVSFFPEKLETVCFWDCDLPAPLDLTNLKHLKKLEIQYRMWSDSPEELSFQHTSNLSDYHIYAGERRPAYLLESSESIKRSIQLYKDGFEIEGLNSLIARAEEVRLEYCSNITVGRIYNNNREAFADLRNLHIEWCESAEYVARISTRGSFSQLTVLEIIACPAMKYVFSKSVAKCLGQLQELRIERCGEMEAIVINEVTSDEDEDDDIINFSNLKSLTIYEVPGLKSFYVEEKDMSVVQALPLFNQMVAFPSLEKLSILSSGDEVSEIWGKNENGNVLSSSSPSFLKLKTIKIYSCKKLKTAIPLSMLNKLKNLQVLEVANCDSMINVFQHSSITTDLINLQTLKVEKCSMMREIIGGGEQVEAAVLLFSQLTTLRLYKLPSLTSFWGNQRGETNSFKIQLPNLVIFQLFYNWGQINLEVIELGRDDSNCQLRTLALNCDNKEIQLPGKWFPRLYNNLESLQLEHYHWWPQLKFNCFKRLKVLIIVQSRCSTLFSFSAFESLNQLQKLEIEDCDLLEEIVEDVWSGEPSVTDKRTVTLSQLKSVSLYKLPKLKSCFHGANYEFHMPALEEVKVVDCGISTLFTCSVLRTLQQLKDLGVWKCRLLGEIVEDAKGDETSDTNHNIITLPRFWWVHLDALPNLKSFSSNSSYAFNMPVLQRIYVYGCPRIETFTCLKTTTPLVDVSINGCEMKTSDPNDCVRAARDKTTKLSITKHKYIRLQRNRGG